VQEVTVTVKAVLADLDHLTLAVTGRGLRAVSGLAMMAIKADLAEVSRALVAA
jgi:hypothetical protein